MFKIPKFFKILLVCHLLFFLFYLFQSFLCIQPSPQNNDPITEIVNLYQFYVLFPLAAVFLLLFYNLLALKKNGYFLQVGISLLFVLLCLMSLFGYNIFLKPFFLGYLPDLIVAIYCSFNIFTLYYFFKPSTIRIFFYPKSLNSYYYSRMAILDSLPQCLEKEKKVNNKTKPLLNKQSIENLSEKEKLNFLPNARILVTESSDPKKNSVVTEYNLMINNKAKKIVLLMTQMLPSLKEAEYIDDYSYSYFQTFSWHVDDIIFLFKQKAVERCKNIGDSQDKLLGYSKKVYEIDLLSHTNDLMSEWINNTGKNVDELILSKRNFT